MAIPDPGRTFDRQIGKPATFAQLPLSEPRKEGGVEKRPAGAQRGQSVCILATRYRILVTRYRILVARYRGARSPPGEHLKKWLGQHRAWIEPLGGSTSDNPSQHRAYHDQARQFSRNGCQRTRIPAHCPPQWKTRNSLPERVRNSRISGRDRKRFRQFG